MAIPVEAKPVVISTPEKLAEGNSIPADKQPSEDIINNSPEAQKVIQEPTNSEEKIVLSPLDKNKKCSVCLAHRPPSAFTRNQWQKPDTRTCKSCPMQRRPTSPLTSPINSPIPLPAPQLELAVDDMALPWLWEARRPFNFFFFFVPIYLFPLSLSVNLLMDILL